jgi:hypothetical protein
MLHVAPLGFLSFPAGGYVPAGAIWLDGSADYLSWTPSTGSTNTDITYSFWTKRAGLTAYGAVLSGQTSGTPGQSDFIRYSNNDAMETIGDDGNDWSVKTTAVYRDPTAWEHWVVSFNDTTNVRMWKNGVEITDFATNTESGTMGGWLRATQQIIGKNQANQYYQGYLAEVIALDGTAVTDATSFGEYDTNNNWIPKDPSGLTFGTNGFWLNFADSADLGKDASGVTTENIINAGFGAIISDLTSSESSIFDGSTSSGYAQKSSATSVYAGKNWGTGVTRSITKVRIYGKSGFANSNFIDSYSSTVNYKLEGSATGAWSGEEVLLGSTSFTDDDGSAYQELTPGTTTAYQYHRVVLDGFTSNTVTWGEIEFFSQGNDFTPISMSAANSTSDRPADDAENDLGNYAFINPIHTNPTYTANGTLSEGNLKFSVTGDSFRVGSIAVSSGKWYWEVTNNNPATYSQSIGILSLTNKYGPPLIANTSSIYSQYSSYNGNHNIESSSSAYGSAWHTANDVAGIALDLDNGAVWYHKNGTWQASATQSEIEAGNTTNAARTGLTGLFGPLIFANDGAMTHNFGQSNFAYTPPAGFKALNTANLPAPTVTDPSVYFNTVLYTGTDAIQSVTGVGFQPDLVWIKTRSNSLTNHQLYDVLRAAPNYLYPNQASAQQTLYSDVLTSFDSDGFSLGADASSRDCNYLGRTYVAWCLKAGGAGSANTDGSITSTVSTAAHGGFSIGTFTGTGASATVGHGLSSAPAMIIVKDRDAANEWSVYHSELGPGKDLQLESTANANTNAALWNNTAPTASVFSVSTIARQNASGNSLVFYAFAKTPGLIGIGSYVGNGSTDGPYVVVDDGGSGFRPAWVIFKRSDSTSSWVIQDAVRNTYNPVSNYLTTGADAEGTSGVDVDFTANGFKIRTISNSHNTNGGTYIYLAFAEYPFGGDGVAQAKAR